VTACSTPQAQLPGAWARPTPRMARRAPTARTLTARIVTARTVLARGFVMLGLVGAGTMGCTPTPPPRAAYSVINGDPRHETSVPDVSQAEWTVSRERLARIRAEVPVRPYVERVQIGVIDPRSGKRYQARGAVAISPERAARLVLLGPGGTTALDVWVTRDRFRLAIPSIKLEMRGGSDLSEARGLPIGFLRWWFLAPLDGELLLARSNNHESAFLLRDGPATVTVRTNGERFIAVRRENGRLDGLEWSGRGLVPRAGARGQYVDGVWGVRVQVVVEEVLQEEPDPAAFFDPDDKGTSL
jgi:hypothetical protein